jgi:hypothetical protein
MRLGKLVHIEWGDEPLIKLTRREAETLIEGVWIFMVGPIFLVFICPWVGKCAASMFQ